MEDKEKGYKNEKIYGSYNEPSWVPEGFCKCCSSFLRDDGQEVRRDVTDLVKLQILPFKTESKDLDVYFCPKCDKHMLKPLENV